jgi:hypothetical protein
MPSAKPSAKPWSPRILSSSPDKSNVVRSAGGTLGIQAKGVSNGSQRSRWRDKSAGIAVRHMFSAQPAPELFCGNSIHRLRYLAATSLMPTLTSRSVSSALGSSAGYSTMCTTASTSLASGLRTPRRIMHSPVSQGPPIPSSLGLRSCHFRLLPASPVLLLHCESYRFQSTY